MDICENELKSGKTYRWKEGSRMKKDIGYQQIFENIGQDSSSRPLITVYMSGKVNYDKIINHQRRV